MIPNPMSIEESCSVDCTQMKMRTESELLMRERHKDSLVQNLTNCRQTLLSMCRGGRHMPTFRTNTLADVLIKSWFKFN